MGHVEAELVYPSTFGRAQYLSLILAYHCERRTTVDATVDEEEKTCALSCQMLLHHTTL